MKKAFKTSFIFLFALTIFGCSKKIKTEPNITTKSNNLTSSTITKSTTKATSKITSAKNSTTTNNKTTTSVTTTNKITTKSTTTKITTEAPKYGDITYIWNGYTCTATKPCLNYPEKSIVEEVIGIYQKISDKTLTEYEKGKYVATFTNPIFETQELEVTGTEYDVAIYGDITYVWNGNICTATKPCTNYPEKSIVEEVIGVYNKTSDKTLTEYEKGYYLAVFETSCFENQTKDYVGNEYDVAIYGDITYVWNSNICTATKPCTNYPSETITEEVTGIYQKISDKTLTEYEKGKYVATFTNPIFETQELEVTGTEYDVAVYGDITYVWDGNKCIATKPCTNYPSVTITEEVTGIYTKVSDATCTSYEAGHYTATFTNDAFETQTKNVSGNTYGSHTYEEAWSYDETYHYHSATCGHDLISNQEEHNFGAEVLVKAATLTEYGEKTQACQTCDYVKHIQIDKLKATITFDSNSGSGVDTQYLYAGSLITKPTDPTRTNYEFDGWFYNNVLWDFTTNTVSNNMTLVAQWTRLYTVSFTNTPSTIDSQTVRSGGKVSEPTAPTKSDYDFDGWYNGSTKWNFTNNTVSSDIILTAKWVTPEIEGYNILWADEFEGNSLDFNYWSYEPHEPGWVNEELQEYTQSTSNVYVENGNVVIKANKNGNEYTSGKITTQNKVDFMYGKVVARAKAPEGKGLWPAIWMMPTDESHYGSWPRCGELDIMEVLGHETNKAYCTLHYGNPHGSEQGIKILNSGSFSSDYHTYEIDWEPGEIRWYIDGELILTVNDWYSSDGSNELDYPAPFNQTFFVQLNLAVGGSWPGNPDGSTNFDNAKFYVDYVRVYQKPYYDTNVTKPEKVGREPDATGNYIYNGTFADATENLYDNTGWQYIVQTDLGASGSIEIVNGEVKITSTNNGTEDWHIQFINNDVPLVKGATYRLSFDARTGSGTRTINSINLSSPSRDYQWHGGMSSVNVTTTKSTFQTEFTMTHDDDIDARLEFNLGNTSSNSTLYISNVKLVRIS